MELSYLDEKHFSILEERIYKYVEVLEKFKIQFLKVFPADYWNNLDLKKLSTIHLENLFLELKEANNNPFLDNVKRSYKLQMLNDFEKLENLCNYYSKYVNPFKCDHVSINNGVIAYPSNKAIKDLCRIKGDQNSIQAYNELQKIFASLEKIGVIKNNTLNLSDLTKYVMGSITSLDNALSVQELTFEGLKYGKPTQTKVNAINSALCKPIEVTINPRTLIELFNQ